ncbi:Epsin-2 [Cichlidogyrus casuarinus]|uniref:Epsin-2 n=1 Tax=Cichlidogyrus casuarinus TaxID=1844966 RepID=A0ABD2QBF5_9PLAT
MLPIHRHIKNVVNNYSEAEIKVREATSNDSWGPSTTIMNEISHMSYNMISITEIMRMLWRRLNDRNKNWRHVYKSLILLDFLVKNGSNQIALHAKSNIHTIQILEQFNYIEDGKDYGKAIREKARSLRELLMNDEAIRSERQKALSTTNRLDLVGFGANEYPPPSNSRLRTSPLHSDSFGQVSEYETAMPQSAIEEDLQIQLALAISKEEHEKEEQRRRTEQISEDTKLKLAMERSQQETNGDQASSGGALFSLVDISLSAAPASVPDPWALNFTVPSTSQAQPQSQASILDT